jgi:hypothetical protein
MGPTPKISVRVLPPKLPPLLRCSRLGARSFDPAPGGRPGHPKLAAHGGGLKRPGDVCRAGCVRLGGPKAFRLLRRGGGLVEARAGCFECPGALGHQRSSRLSESRRSTFESASGSTCASHSLGEAANAVARISSPSLLGTLPALSAPSPAQSELGRPVNHELAGRCQPPRQVTTEPAGVLHHLGRRSGNRLAQCWRDLKSALFCGKLARSRNSPTCSSIAATATPTPCGDRPRSRPSHERTHLRFGRTPLPPLACAKDIPTSGSAPIALLSHFARRTLRWDASREQANPSLMGDRKFRSDPCNRHPRSLAAADHRAPDQS